MAQSEVGSYWMQFHVHSVLKNLITTLRHRSLLMKDKKFLALSSIFFLLFIIGMLSLTLQKPASQLLKAMNVVPSPLKSFIIVYPQVVPAGDRQIKVSVYLRDVNSNVLPDREIQLIGSPGSINISPAQSQITNDLGMAQFYITSNVPGEVQITAADVASGTTIVNSPSVEFTP